MRKYLLSKYEGAKFIFKQCPEEVSDGEWWDVLHLINILKGFHSRYPHLKVILEPGSAFGWQTGPLVTQVVDVVEDKGIRTAIINASFTCHMPDCLEMPYMPTVRNAETLEVDDPMKAPEGDHIYRIGCF